MDDALEIIPPTRRMPVGKHWMQKKKLAIALDNKKEANATINIKIHENSGEAASMKVQLRRKGLESSRREELKFNSPYLRPVSMNKYAKLKSSRRKQNKFSETMLRQRKN